MPTLQPAARVLIVDDNRDGADALGLVVEALGHQVHVTYGGMQALDVATAFRPDLMLIDLAMPDMDGCHLARCFRGNPAWADRQIVAITGHADAGHKTLALKAGFNAVLFKPVTLRDMEAVLADPRRLPLSPGTNRPPQPRLPIDEARRIRHGRTSKSLTEAESEAAIREGMHRFQEEYLGWRSEKIQAHFIKDLLVIRIAGVLTRAECQLGKSPSPEKGRDLIKQVRKQLLELARPMLESLVHEVAGVKVVSLHHDISTTTGEEVVVFTLVSQSRFDSESV